MSDKKEPVCYDGSTPEKLQAAIELIAGVSKVLELVKTENIFPGCSTVGRVAVHSAASMSPEGWPPELDCAKIVAVSTRTDLRLCFGNAKGSWSDFLHDSEPLTKELSSPGSRWLKVLRSLEEGDVFIIVVDQFQ